MVGQRRHQALSLVVGLVDVFVRRQAVVLKGCKDIDRNLPHGGKSQSLELFTLTFVAFVVDTCKFCSNQTQVVIADITM